MANTNTNTPPPYTLTGREITGDHEHGACIFCGATIAHVDAGPDAPIDLPRVGYFINATVDGERRTYIMHEIGDRCPERNAVDATTINGDPLTESTPESDRVIWRCNCSGEPYDPDYGSFVENVGDLCECGATRESQRPRG